MDSGDSSSDCSDMPQLEPNLVSGEGNGDVDDAGPKMYFSEVFVLDVNASDLGIHNDDEDDGDDEAEEGSVDEDEEEGEEEEDGDEEDGEEEAEEEEEENDKSSENVGAVEKQDDLQKEKIDVDTKDVKIEDGAEKATPTSVVEGQADAEERNNDEDQEEDTIQIVVGATSGFFVRVIEGVEDVADEGIVLASGVAPNLGATGKGGGKKINSGADEEDTLQRATSARTGYRLRILEAPVPAPARPDQAEEDESDDEVFGGAGTGTRKRTASGSSGDGPKPKEGR